MLVKRGRSSYFDALLTLDDLDSILATLEFRYPDIFLVDAQRQIESAEYTRENKSIDPARLYALHDTGATIVLNHLNTCHPALADMCSNLALEFSAPIQTNIYITPPGAQGFKAHFDTHDVFVLQVHGSKQWRLHQTAIALPLAGQENEKHDGNPAQPTDEFDLQAGDALYIPRGVTHDAQSCDETSVHITVGLLCYTWTDVLLETFAGAALKNVAFRKALPCGIARADFDRDTAREEFRRLLSLFSESADVDEALDTFVDTFIDSRRPSVRHRLLAPRAVEALTCKSVVARKSDLAYSLQDSESSVTVRCYGRLITIPSPACAALRYALACEHFQVSELPGDLDDDSKLVLVRRLVREGILTIT